MIRMPVYFLSHGGGPWPYVEGMRQQFATTEREFRALPERLPAKPKAVLVITGHWEADEFTVSSAEHQCLAVRCSAWFGGGRRGW